MDEKVYLPQTDITRYKAGNMSPWKPVSGLNKRDDCIPMDMVCAHPFSPLQFPGMLQLSLHPEDMSNFFCWSDITHYGK